MSDSTIITENFTARLISGYHYDIERLRLELSKTSAPAEFSGINRMLGVKEWHLQRHLADLAERENHPVASPM